MRAARSRLTATLRSARGEVMNLFKEMGALPAALGLVVEAEI